MPKVKLSVWVEPETKEALQVIALKQSKKGASVTVSDVVNGFLELAVDGELEGTYEALLGMRYDGAVRDTMGKMARVLSTLLSRTALEATTTRLMVLHEVQVAKGRSYEKNLYDLAHTRALDTLKSPDLGLQQVVEEYLRSGGLGAHGSKEEQPPRRGSP